MTFPCCVYRCDVTHEGRVQIMVNTLTILMCMCILTALNDFDSSLQSTVRFALLICSKVKFFVPIAKQFDLLRIIGVENVDSWITHRATRTHSNSNLNSLCNPNSSLGKSRSETKQRQRNEKGNVSRRRFIERCRKPQLFVRFWATFQFSFPLLKPTRVWPCLPHRYIFSSCLQAWVIHIINKSVGKQQLGIACPVPTVTKPCCRSLPPTRSREKTTG